MFTISKEFHFSASHQLEGLPADHQCARLHGHNYILKVSLIAEELDNVGFVVDYGELVFVKNTVDDFLDHRHLNDHFSFNPTSENIVRHYAHQLADTVRMSSWDHVLAVEVALSETPKTWATYRLDVRR